MTESNITVWVDPICPWCWTTARWLTEVIQPERDLVITWKPISLLLKNKPSPDIEWYPNVEHTHKLLRVFEAIEAAEGNEAAFRFYKHAGDHIHHQGDTFVEASTLLQEAGFDPSYADAYDDESWDGSIKAKMAEGLNLVGEDVGTPIIGFESDEGTVGVFGPVISRVLKGDEALDVWDAVRTLAHTEGFWELKRTRTKEPNFDL